MITDTAVRDTFPGPVGALGTLNTTFRVFAISDIKVDELDDATGVFTAKVLTTDFTVVLGGGAMPVLATVTNVNAIATGKTWVIYRDLPDTQEVGYTTGGAFPSASHEKALDRSAMRSQEHTDALSRALVIPRSDAEGLDMTIPQVADRKSKYLGFDVAGLPVDLAAPTDTTIVSGFWATVLSAVDRAAAFLLLSPTTTRGDIIRRGTTNDEPVPKGGRGAVFVMPDGNDPDWRELGASGKVFASDGTDPLWTPPRTLASAWPKNYLYGLAISISASDLDHDVSISAFDARDDLDTVNQIHATSIVKRIDDTWQAGTGNGGLSDSTVLVGPDNLYIFALSDNTDGQSVTEDIGFDPDITGAGILADAAVVLAGLTTARLIGICTINGLENIASVSWKQGDGSWLWTSRIFSPAGSGTDFVINPFSLLPEEMWAQLIDDAASGGYATGDIHYQDFGVSDIASTDDGISYWASAAGNIGFSNEVNFALVDEAGGSTTPRAISSFNIVLKARFAADAL